VRFLLDTHVLLWWLADDPKLSQATRDTLGDPDAELFVSAASVWEITIKANQDKLQLPDDWLNSVEESQLRPLPITFQHATSAGWLPLLHRDPFDRMLVAQAAVEGLTIVTRDSRITRYDVATLQA
jgi:PIN domain nuclease of toxin-antitoxin system